MPSGNFIRERFGLGVLLLSLLVFAAQCSKPAPALPTDLLGLRVGMSREAAQKRLIEIAVFERDEEKRQQVWRLKSDARFDRLAIGFDADDRARYITAFVDAATAKERIRFSDVGDLSRAKKEILAPHYRYIWEAAGTKEDDGEKEKSPGYLVNIYGDNPDFVTIFTLAEKYDPNRAGDDDEK